MNKSVLGIVESRLQAESALNELRERGILGSAVSVMFPDTDGTRDFVPEHRTKAPQGAVAGASTGGVIGGALGVLAGVGVLAIPGAGAFIAAGPIMAALSGAAAGATAGGLIGALVGLGIPEYEAKAYQERIKKGGYLVAVHVEDGDKDGVVRDIMKRNGLDDVSSTSEK